MQLVSSAENSSLDWKAQYKYIEDIGDGRGYTAGIIGFCSGTGDMLDLVELYTQAQARTTCSRKYLPALREVDGTRLARGPRPGLHRGLEDGRPGPGLPAGPERRARPGLLQPGGQPGQGATACGALGQFVYYDAIVMHGAGNDSTSFGGIRATRALAKAKPPGAGRRRDGVPQRLPRRPRSGDEDRRRRTATPAASTPPSGSSSTTATSTSAHRWTGRCTATRTRCRRSVLSRRRTCRGARHRPVGDVAGAVVCSFRTPLYGTSLGWTVRPSGNGPSGGSGRAGRSRR